MFKDIEAVILAGGLSSRMKRDKALLPFGGYSTLAEYQYKRLLRVFSKVSLSAKEDKFPFKANLILDKEPTYSPLIALKKILSESKYRGVFIIGVDMPYIDESIINTLAKEFYKEQDFKAIVPKSPNGLEPLCAIYRQNFIQEIDLALSKDNHRLREVIRGSSYIVDFSKSEAFINLNYPQDYNLAIKQYP